MTTINFKTDTKIKTQAQEIAEAMGLNLSNILNIYLKGFVRTKELHINLKEDESRPSKELLTMIKEAREEYKNGKIKKFKNIDAAITHLEKI